MGLHQCPSERNGEGGPVRRLYVPSHVPSHPQTAAEVRGFSLTAAGFTAETDWLLEETGFEPSVPPSSCAVLAHVAIGKAVAEAETRSHTSHAYGFWRYRTTAPRPPCFIN